MADFWALPSTFAISMRNIANGQKEKEEYHKLCPTVTPTLVPIIVRHGEAFKFPARWI